MTERLRIAGGRVYDPANGVDGEVRDVCIEDGRIVADAARRCARARRPRPGGDAGRRGHSHPRRRAHGEPGAPPDAGRARDRCPSTLGHADGLYALLGYTTAFDAAVPLVGARHAHLELDDTPFLDKGFYVVLGNDDFLLRPLGAGEDERARETLAWACRRPAAYGGQGGESRRRGCAWKRSAGVPGLDDARRRAGPDAAAHPRRRSPAPWTRCGCPTPCTSTATTWACAGNASTTLETMRALEGQRAHFAHLQFHAYGGEPGGRPRSRAREVIEELNRRRT